MVERCVRAASDTPSATKYSGIGFPAYPLVCARSTVQYATEPLPSDMGKTHTFAEEAAMPLAARCRGVTPRGDGAEAIEGCGTGCAGAVRAPHRVHNASPATG